MVKYRKKPVVIEAVQWKPNEMLIYDLMEQFGGLDEMRAKSLGKKKGKLVIKTLEGEMTADDGDYIIRGINGEFYPCKPDIFHKTYEKVE
ncbi:hypothetical protein NIE88_22060 [Sporolactobacillus shoreicorticis]|uniref:Phage protein n=1 Tax=Sporolactobacillus shoreicorticis TaxID=1923877 RepID=A0ABW5S6V8_9BACL|nr:hypothetical protein [Sporolactobacillus shoreicorticis]MCO7128410.1 hypothetical protein [Sporolactobacillus shoreicorticis]